MIVVNDGSPDESLERALRLQRDDPRLVVIDRSRNSGPAIRAMMVGLLYARGERVFLLDSDLKEEPEDLSRFHERFVGGEIKNQ